jgi:hypothetical protein
MYISQIFLFDHLFFENQGKINIENSGVSPHVRSALLNHTSGHAGGGSSYSRAGCRIEMVTNQCDSDTSLTTDEELSPEDCQAMEDFMKQRAERDRQEVEKLTKQKDEEDRLPYLSQFKKTREGKVKKIKDITFDTPPPEVPPNVSTSSSPSSFVTVNDLTTVMDSFRLSMIENMQNMVDSR